MRIGRLEQETIILFNEEESWASIYTCNGKLKRKLKQMSHECPEKIRLINSDALGSQTYELPKELITVRKPVKDEVREAARVRALRENRKPPERDKSSKNTTQNEGSQRDTEKR